MEPQVTSTPAAWMPRPRTVEIALYLDLDGVVQHQNVRWSKRRGVYMAEPGYTLFEWAPYLEQALAPFPHVALVLSSSWCVWPGYGKTLKRFPAGLRDRFIGGTYHRREHVSDPRLKAVFQSMSRGQQVCSDALRRRPGQWLALDDDTDNWPEWARHNLVPCNGSLGLSCPNVQAELHEKLLWCVEELKKEAWRREDQLRTAGRASDSGPPPPLPSQRRDEP
jgi:hypothetical protein